MRLGIVYIGTVPPKKIFVDMTGDDFIQKTQTGLHARPVAFSEPAQASNPHRFCRRVDSEPQDSGVCCAAPRGGAMNAD
jgi:ligand-binding sensor protein